MGTHPIFESDFDCLTDLISDYNATTNPRDQGIPLHCPAQGCLIGQDQEEHGKHQGQGHQAQGISRNQRHVQPALNCFNSVPVRGNTRVMGMGFTYYALMCWIMFYSFYVIHDEKPQKSGLWFMYNDGWQQHRKNDAAYHLFWENDNIESRGDCEWWDWE